MKYVFAGLMILGGLCLAGLAWSYILWQQKAMTRFVATPAAVVRTHIEEHHDKHGTSYSPAVDYQYAVGGTVHQCSQIYTFSPGSGSRSSAEDVLDQFPAAVQRDARTGNLLPNTTAYVNPDDADDAILVRGYRFDPYFGALAALLVALLGLGGVTTDAFTLHKGRMQALTLDDSGWQLLLPRQNLRRRMRNALIWCVVWAVFSLPVLAHWALAARRLTAGSAVGGALALCFLGVLVVAVVRRWSLVRHISDVRLRVKPVPLKRGESFALAMEADSLTGLHVQQARATVLCIEHYKERRGTKTVYGTRTRAQRDLPLCAEGVLAAGQMLEGAAETVFPAAECPATSADRKSYPYYTWEVRLKIALRGAVDYEALFPLEAQ